jgi:hypothetical protein
MLYQEKSGNPGSVLILSQKWVGLHFGQYFQKPHLVTLFEKRKTCAKNCQIIEKGIEPRHLTLKFTMTT